MNESLENENTMSRSFSLYSTVFLFFILLLVETCAPSLAQQKTGLIDNPAQKLEQARGALDQIEATLQRDTLPDAALLSLRNQIDPISSGVQATLEDLGPKLEAARIRLEQLGPKPTDKATPESPGVTAERADQEKNFAELDETVKRARVLAVQADQASAAIAARRRALFMRALFERSYSILSPRLWLDVARELPQNLRAIQIMGGDWLSGMASRLSGWRLPVLVFLFTAMGALYYFASRLIIRAGRGDQKNADFTRLAKVFEALKTIALIMLFPLLGLAMATSAFEAFDLVNPRVQPVIKALVDGIIRISLTLALSRALLAPACQPKRLLDLGDDVSDRLARLALNVALVISATRLLEAINDVIASALPVLAATRASGAFIVALIMAITLNGILVGEDEDKADACLGPRVPPQDDHYGAIRMLAWAAIAGIAGSILIGYVSLASFLVDQIAWIGGVGSILYLLLVLVDEGLSHALDPQAAVGRTVINSIGLRRESLAQIRILLSGGLRVALFGLASLLVLAPWGIQSDDMAGSLRAAFFGFRVGDVTISLSSIIVAIFLFLAGTLITQTIQRWLEVSYLPLTQLDTGLRNSIKTSLGYVGFMVAVSVALAYLGLNFEKLAIVAGALSVGIGFGLQSIVNNFVSGLIMLWERAIRVGDWIVVGEEQGYVRRINVRSTEIETFDRATVIVPNSNLVSGVVKNWVRTDRVGRVKIKVTVSLAADPEKVREILIGAAKAHAMVLAIPAPLCLFTVLGESGLGFELMCYVEDVETSGLVRSDLHFDIFKRLRENGVDMPVSNPVVTINGLDRIERLFARPAGEELDPAVVSVPATRNATHG